MPDVRRPKEFEEMLYDLCQSDNRIFQTYKDALVFAACLGFKQGERNPFDKSSEPVGLHIFHGEFDSAVFHCLLLAESTDVNAMSDQALDERIRAFEEYAAYGLETLRNRVYESSRDWDDAITDLVLEQFKGEKGILQGIADLAGG